MPARLARKQRTKLQRGAVARNSFSFKTFRVWIISFFDHLGVSEVNLSANTHRRRHFARFYPFAYEFTRVCKEVCSAAFHTYGKARPSKTISEERMLAVTETVTETLGFYIKNQRYPESAAVNSGLYRETFLVSDGHYRYSAIYHEKPIGQITVPLRRLMVLYTRAVCQARRKVRIDRALPEYRRDNRRRLSFYEMYNNRPRLRRWYRPDLFDAAPPPIDDETAIVKAYRAIYRRWPDPPPATDAEVMDSLYE